MNNASLSTFFFFIVLAYIMTITLGVPEHALKYGTVLCHFSPPGVLGNRLHLGIVLCISAKRLTMLRNTLKRLFFNDLLLFSLFA